MILCVALSRASCCCCRRVRQNRKKKLSEKTFWSLRIGGDLRLCLSIFFSRVLKSNNDVMSHQMLGLFQVFFFFSFIVSALFCPFAESLPGPETLVASLSNNLEYLQHYIVQAMMDMAWKFEVNLRGEKISDLNLAV